jgi:signal transduction histidine kinase
VALASTALFAVWLDPAEPARYAALTYTLYWVYVTYSGALALATLNWEGGRWLPLITHAVDIGAFSVFQYLTLGPSSPFFVYFVFSMFCGAIRWGWRGTLITGALVMVFYVAIARSIDLSVASPEFELNRFVVRLVYLGVATALLVYLGLYEARLRSEIERLARWPVPVTTKPDVGIARILEYAARLVQAGRVLVVWEVDEEPDVQEALWVKGTLALNRHPPGGLPVLVDDSLAKAPFICTGPVREARSILTVDAGGRLVRRMSMPLTQEVLDRLDGVGLTTATFRTDVLSGRIFFADLRSPANETLLLTQIVAREIGSSFDQVHAATERQELLAREERIRVARDLHDGVLQGLTGVRLELRAIATTAPEGSAPLRDQLVALERALAMEQRDLRFFISGLEPTADRQIDRRSTLALRLDSMRERLALEWKTPVTLRVAPRIEALPDSIADAVPLMVHEATVNALKHAHPARVAVDIEAADGHLRIAVTDDGHGFPFKGRFAHAALARLHGAPRSLFDRVSALGGQMSIESSDHGSRVEMLLSL